MLSQMSRTSRRISDAVMAAAFGRPEHEFLKIAEDIATEARHLLTRIEGLPIPAQGFVSDNPYISPNVPEGYETVFGYMEMVNSGYLDYVKLPLKEAYRVETRKIRALSSRRRMPICEVPAPIALRDEGEETVLAFPITLIREVLY
jgi:hypothetical protein